jgi:hypothetical protein
MMWLSWRVDGYPDSQEISALKELEGLLGPVFFTKPVIFLHPDQILFEQPFLRHICQKPILG